MDSDKIKAYVVKEYVTKGSRVLQHGSTSTLPSTILGCHHFIAFIYQYISKLK